MGPTSLHRLWVGVGSNPQQAVDLEQFLTLSVPYLTCDVVFTTVPTSGVVACPSLAQCPGNAPCHHCDLVEVVTLRISTFKSHSLALAG